MFATGTLSLSPYLNLAGIAALAAWIGLGLCVALAAGFVVRRRDDEAGPTIAFADGEPAAADQPPRARLNG